MQQFLSITRFPLLSGMTCWLATRCLQAFMLVAIGSVARADEKYESPFVAGFDRFYRESAAAAGGRLLLSELSCTACHATADAGLQPKRGPNLSGAGRRFQDNWLRDYLTNPQAIKPGTTMPNVLHGLKADQKQQAIAAIVAFLSVQKPGYPVLKSTAGNPIALQYWRKGDHKRGAHIYHQIGCVACHAADEKQPVTAYQRSDLERMLSQLDSDEIKELGLTDAVRRVRSIPFGDVASKYTSKSLSFFLYAPERSRPAGRMPSLKLRPDEAADIAAYLTGNRVIPDQASPEPDETLVEAGRRFFVELRCVQCHAAGDLKPEIVARPLADVKAVAASTCLGKPQAGLPHYALHSAQNRSIRAALDTLDEKSVSAASTRMLQLNCYACHHREGRGGVGPKRRRYFETLSKVDIGDEGRLPPPLDHVGRKLKVKALAGVLQGTLNVRPHMTIRMPVFAAKSVATLPGELIRNDAGQQLSARDVFGETARLAQSGRLLFDIGCVQCHLVRGENLPGVVGVDVVGVVQRIEPQWFHDFLLNPAKLKHRTRMPTFFPNGRSANPDILEGNVERQVAALWAYFNEIEKLPLPQKIIDGKAHDFELIPGKRPILLRTFMKAAGTHAIAVGFGDKVHFAYDTENVRLAQAWRGRFIDAHGTWFDRFTPPAVPLGDDVIGFPDGVSFALLPSDDAPWPTNKKNAIRFRGYRIDSNGVPTLLYRLGVFDIEDRIVPDDQAGLKRSFRLLRTDRKMSHSATLWFRGNVGRSLRRKNARSYKNDDDLTVTVSQSVREPGTVRNEGHVQEWVMPIPVKREASFEVNYRW
jgi:cytochrome c2